MKPILSTLLVLLCVGCSFRSVQHSPRTAAEAANIFLKAMYVQHDYKHALDLSDDALRKSATTENLSQMVELSERNCGALKELKADFYLMAQGTTMELYYVERCDRSVLYHRLVMAGDVSSGYRVAGVWFQNSPYSDHGLRRQFEGDIVVK